MVAAGEQLVVPVSIPALAAAGPPQGPMPSESPIPAVEAQGLGKRYGSVMALDNLTVSIPQGRAVGLLGPNGAGKSTFLKLISGISLPSDGSLQVLGMDSQREALDVKSRLGFMPEFDCLTLDVTAVKYLTHMGRITGLTRTDAITRAHEVLGYLRVADERYRKIRTYSLGMRQKIKLAQAMLHNPDLLLLDEPTSGLDPWSRQEMLALLAHVVRTSGKTVIISTHILQDVEFLCRNVVVINQGRLVLEGQVSELMGRELGFTTFRVGGDDEPLARALEHRGWEVERMAGEVRVHSLDQRAIDDGVEIAARLGLPLRFATQGVRTLEDVFIELLVRHKEDVALSGFAPAVHLGAATPPPQRPPEGPLP